jgi:hypothetical protein
MQIFGKEKIRYNFHLEDIHKNWLSQAGKNIWIPNQEYVRGDTLDFMGSMDYILCKTRVGYEVFRDIHHHSIYTGYSSLDRLDERYQKDYFKCLHLMGQSQLKGTKALLNVWSRHTDWPQLYVVVNSTTWNNVDWIYSYSSQNISIVNGPLPESEIIKLQNICGIHLCPSEAEGFGHYIVEALSVRSIVLTTNAGPMNEHIDNSIGFLAEHKEIRNKGLGTRYFVREESLEEKIQQILALSILERSRLGEMARLKYLDIDATFSDRLSQFLSSAGVGG